MVKNLIQQKEQILWQNLKKLKMFYFIEKLIDTKGEEFRVRSLNQELMKLTKHRYRVLMIKDLFQMMKFFINIVSHAVKRFKKVMTKKERLKKIVMMEKDCDN